MNIFCAAHHKYSINGRTVPSVTQVLGDLIPGWKASDWYLERGRSVHACAAFVAQGKNFTVPECAIGQVAALRRFYSEVKPVVLAVEMQVYSVAHQYAGTLDLLTYKPGGTSPMVLDFKASLSLSVSYQCAAYADAYEEQTRKPVRWGCGVEIRENGTYQMGEIYDLRLYKQDWYSLLRSFGIRRKCGIKEMEDAA